MQKRARLTFNEAFYLLSFTRDETHLTVLLLVKLLLILRQLLTRLHETVLYPVLNGHQTDMALWVPIEHHIAGFESSERLAKVDPSLLELCDVALSLHIFHLLLLLFRELADPSQVRPQIDWLHQLGKFVKCYFAI